MRVLNDKGAPCEIQNKDILYFTSHQNTIFVHTRENEFVLPTSLSDLFAAYQEMGFERLDRSNVVKISNIGDYDKKRKVVLFKDSQKFAVVSEPNERKVKSIVELHKDKKEDLT